MIIYAHTLKIDIIKFIIRCILLYAVANNIYHYTSYYEIFYKTYFFYKLNNNENT